MTARGWTREELDRVHPLPDGWAWRLWAGEPMACSGTLEIFADGDEVWGQGRESSMTALPCAVALAVILASRGCDSLAEMAGRLEADSRKGAVHDWERGYAAGLAFAAAVVRRGRVNP